VADAAPARWPGVLSAGKQHLGSCPGMAKHFRLSGGTGGTVEARRSSICEKYEEDWRSVAGATHSNEGQGSVPLSEVLGLPQQVSEWTAAHVQGWALSLGVPPEAALQLKLRRVNGRTLQKLSAVDLLAMGFDKIGHLRQLLEGRQDLLGRMPADNSARSECTPGEDADLEGLGSTVSVATTVPPGAAIEGRIPGLQLDDWKGAGPSTPMAEAQGLVPGAQLDARIGGSPSTPPAAPRAEKQTSTAGPMPQLGCPALGVPTPLTASSTRALGLTRWNESPIIYTGSEAGGATARNCVSRSSSARSSSRGLLSNGGFQAGHLAQADNSNNRNAGEGKLVRSASSNARTWRMQGTPTQAMRGAPVAAAAGMPSSCRQNTVITTSPSAPCSPGTTFRSQRQEESQPQSMGCPAGWMPAPQSWSPPSTAATTTAAIAAAATAPANGGACSSRTATYTAASATSRCPSQCRSATSAGPPAAHTGASPAATAAPETPGRTSPRRCTALRLSSKSYPGPPPCQPQAATSRRAGATARSPTQSWQQPQGVSPAGAALAGQQQGRPTPRSSQRTCVRHCSDGRAQVMSCSAGSATTTQHAVGVVPASAASSGTSSLPKRVLRQPPASPGSTIVPGSWVPPAVASRGHGTGTGSGDSSSSAVAAASSSYVPPPSRGSAIGAIQLANNQAQGASPSTVVSVEGGTKSRRRVSMLVRETASAFGTALAAATVQGQRAVVSGTAGQREEVYCVQESPDWCRRGTGNATVGFAAASVSSEPWGR